MSALSPEGPGAPLAESAGRRRRRRPAQAPETTTTRAVDYHHLRHPFAPLPVFTEDRVEAIHEAALETLERLGVKVLLAEARALFAAAGCLVDEESQMVRLGREVVEAALAAAPRRIEGRAGVRAKDLVFELGTLCIQSGAGAPHATDRIRGRRPGRLVDFEETTRLVQAFDVLQMLSPGVEPQDVPTPLRHYAMMRAELTLSTKFPFVFSRGRGQVADCFEMLRCFRGLGAEAFAATPHCYTIVNTNSPRQIDVPMAQGIIDFARAGQLTIVTPFTLMGAMAPVTVAGALTLAHAEAMAAITLAELAKPGAPVLYGSFTSNVDMKSGAPAFGTPEQIKASLGAGQLARRLGLPWRSSAGCAANVADAQAAQETVNSAWGAILAGCTVLLHGAGWMEGGLTVGYETMITDLEAMQVFAELCAPVPADDAAIALDALEEVAPGGHFFACAHTMARYRDAFYEPIVADWSNFGTWTERGAEDATTRATAIWQRLLAEGQGPTPEPERLAALDRFIAERTAAGGAPPES